MNSRISSIVLPIIAVIVYIGIDFVYIFLAKSRYEKVVQDIQKGDQMEIDAVAAIICYTSQWKSLLPPIRRFIDCDLDFSFV